MTDPIRLRLSRAKGFDLQKHSQVINGLSAVNVARPSRWGNPFVVGEFDNQQKCVYAFGLLLEGFICFVDRPHPENQKAARQYICSNIKNLTGKNLACWCGLDATSCHADILLKAAAGVLKNTMETEV